MVFGEVDADRARDTQAGVGERVRRGRVRRARLRTPRRRWSPRRPTTSAGSTCWSTTSGTSAVGGARSTSNRRGVGRALPRQPRARVHVHACGAARVLSRTRRRRQHRQCLDDRSVPRDPDARRLLRVQVGDHRLHALASRSSTRATAFASTRSHPTSPRHCRCRTRSGLGPRTQHLIPTWVPLGRFGQPADDAAGVAVVPRAAICRSSSPARPCTSTAARSRRADGSRRRRADGPIDRGDPDRRPARRAARCRGAACGSGYVTDVSRATPTGVGADAHARRREQPIARWSSSS